MPSTPEPTGTVRACPEQPAEGFAAYFAWYGAELERARSGLDLGALGQLLGWLEETRRQGRQLFVLGNGGSAASAAHWACDFGKGVNVGDSRRFRVLAPSEHVSWSSALSNDLSFADALAEQLRNWARPGDLVVALSVSGNSENLVRAFAAARSCGARLAAIVGAAAGRLQGMADLAIVIPSRDYGVVEDLHMTVNHILSQYIRHCLEAGGDATACRR